MTGPICEVCNWSNSGCLNLGEHGKPKWVCHGCIKRAFDQHEAALLARELHGLERAAGLSCPYCWAGNEPFQVTFTCTTNGEESVSYAHKLEHGATDGCKASRIRAAIAEMRKR